MGQETLARAEDSLRSLRGRTGLAGDRTLPLAADLASLFPERGLRRGSTVSLVAGPSPTGLGAAGATSLALALVAGPSAEGAWCAVVGVADLGLVAAAQAGVDLARLALVPSPGPKWASVVATLLEGFEVVVLHPPSQPRQVEASNLEARSRESGAALVLLACPGWPGRPELRLEVVGGSWRGLGDGFGYLTGRELEVVATGRGGASKLRRGRVCVGEPTGLPQVRRSGPDHSGPDDSGPDDSGPDDSGPDPQGPGQPPAGPGLLRPPPAGLLGAQRVPAPSTPG